MILPAFDAAYAARRASQVIALPARSSRALASFVRPIADPAHLRTLATTAIEAAMKAGADWADIRISDRRTFAWEGWNNLHLTYGFGVRVRVRGADAFVGGGDPTREHVIRAAQSAVDTARAIAHSPAWAHRSTPMLSPVPIVTGEWRAPIQIDPFSVSIDDHMDVMDSLAGIDDVQLSAMDVAKGFSCDWYGETRVFAASDGSLLTQFLGGVDVREHAIGRGDRWRFQAGETLRLSFPGWGSATRGFEMTTHLLRYDELQAAGNELVRYGNLPSGRIDVGRYNVVLDGSAHATLLSQAVLPALSARRALGYDADVDGTSPLAPMAAVLGQRLFSPLLTLVVDRRVPAFGAVGWDDDGVAPIPGPLISHGTVVNYLGTRITHPFIVAAAQAQGHTQGHPPPLLGIAYAPDVTRRPTELTPSAAMSPTTEPCTLAMLAKQIGTGLLVRSASVYMDTQGTGGVIIPKMMLEVKGGEVIRRVFGSCMQFNTKKLMASLTAVGDQSTIDEQTQVARIGFPQSTISNSMTAPAAFYRNVDVVKI